MFNSVSFVREVRVESARDLQTLCSFIGGSYAKYIYFRRRACKTYVGNTSKLQPLCSFGGAFAPQGALQTLCSPRGGLSYKPYVHFVDPCPLKFDRQSPNIAKVR